jgi:hypothetical protein
MQKTIAFKMPAGPKTGLDVSITLRSLSGHAAMAVHGRSGPGLGNPKIARFSGVERTTLLSAHYAPGTDIVLGVVSDTAWAMYTLTIEAYATGMPAFFTETQV